jgi:gliding motility-associated-like protein
MIYLIKKIKLFLFVILLLIATDIIRANNIDSLVVTVDDRTCSADLNIHLFWFCGNMVLGADSISHEITGSVILLKVRYPASWLTAISYPDTSFKILNVPSGTYTLKCILYSDNTTFGGSEWQKIDSINKIVMVPKKFNFDPFSQDEIVICNDVQNSLLLNASNEKVVSYLWLPNGETSSSIFVTAPSKYIVSVIDTAGCPGKDSITITEKCPTQLFIPNAFTPNKDGVNDIFIPTGEFISDYDLNIYDRWGHIVFKSGFLNKGWNGNNNSTEMPEGVYAYFLSYTGDDGKGSFKKNLIGKVTLIR